MLELPRKLRIRLNVKWKRFKATFEIALTRRSAGRMRPTKAKPKGAMTEIPRPRAAKVRRGGKVLSLRPTFTQRRGRRCHPCSRLTLRPGPIFRLTRRCLAFPRIRPPSRTDPCRRSRFPATAARTIRSSTTRTSLGRRLRTRRPRKVVEGRHELARVTRQVGRFQRVRVMSPRPPQNSPGTSE